MSDLFMSMLKDRKQVVEALLSAMEQSEKMISGLSKVSDSVIENPSDENLRKMVNTTMKCVSKQAKIIQMLALVSLVYTSSSQFSSDVARILIKFGKGEEALREMFNQKLRGN